MGGLICRYFAITLISTLIFTLFPLSSLAAFPSEALQKLDSEVKMATAYQWNNHNEYPTAKYSLPFIEYGKPDYMYESNWYVAVDGKRITSKLMMLLKPRDSNFTNLGRTFSQPNDIQWWAKQFNGNPDYVQRKAISDPTEITHVVSGTVTKRAYSRDLAEWSGAETGFKDTGIVRPETGSKLGEVQIKTTPFPKPVIAMPTKGKPNESFEVDISGQEFYPDTAYANRSPKIYYELKVNGEVKDSGEQKKKTFQNSKNYSFPKGTYTFELKVWDQVERATTTKKTIVIGEGTAPPDGGGSDGEIEPPPPVPSRYEHELDVEVYRLDGRTVEKGTNTKTDVYVKRADFSVSRDQARQEFDDYIEKVQAQKTDAESKKAQYESEKTSAESEKASAESAYTSCAATPPDKDGNTPDCSGYSSDIAAASQKISEMAAKIEHANRMIALYEEAIRKAEAEKAYIQSEEAKYSVVNPSVYLKFNGSLVSQTSVSLREGEEGRYTFPSWTLNSDGEIVAQINEMGSYQEFHYNPLEDRAEQTLGYNTRVGHDLYPSSSSNNWKDTPIYISSHETSACPVPGQYFTDAYVEGIVRTVNEDGNKRVLMEEVRSVFTKLPRSQMRAGFGFEYQVTTQYINHDNEPDPAQETGTKKTESYYPTLTNFLPYSKDPAVVGYINNSPQYKVEGYKVPMETKQNPVSNNENRTWLLPPVAVEEYSGNVFGVRNNDYRTHPKRNLNDNILLRDEKGNELTRWYVDLLQPDGDYIFKVRTYDAGVNKLNTCQQGKVLVKGTIIGDENGDDDFIKRSVSPDNPFPGGIGWDWIGQDSRLKALKEWYRDWYAHPDQLPRGQYNSMYYLTPEKIEEVRKFNEKMNHEYILGISLFNSVQIPTHD